MIPLHVHSNNTFLNGTIPVEKLVQRAKEYQLSAISLTDTNSMHGVVQFAKHAAQKKIKPIIGSLIDNPENAKEYIVLIAKNNKGYSDLCKIISSRKLNDDFSLRNLLKKKNDNLFILTPSIDLIKDSPNSENLFIELIASENEKRSNRNKYQTCQEKGLKYVVTNPVYFLDKEDFLLHKVVNAI
ncbi:MAG: PHP domain-containing protein, partial [Ignavibacteriaceae bacterium]